MDKRDVSALFRERLKALLARSGGAPDFDRLSADLAEVEGKVMMEFERLVV